MINKSVKSFSQDVFVTKKRANIVVFICQAAKNKLESAGCVNNCQQASPST